jgi:hypothetical protein
VARERAPERRTAEAEQEEGARLDGDAGGDHGRRREVWREGGERLEGGVERGVAAPARDREGESTEWRGWKDPMAKIADGAGCFLQKGQGEFGGWLGFALVG